MYRCTGGEVTIGVGHAIHSSADAAALRWQIGQRPASAAEAGADWAKVFAAPKGDVAGAYARLTQCRMADDAINALCEADIESFEGRLAKELPKWNTYPEPVQEALFDMAFNLGIDGLKKFHMLLAAVDRGDWETAAQQCHRMGIQESRNNATAALFRQAKSAAA